MLTIPKKSLKFWLGIVSAALALIPVFYMANIGGYIIDRPSEYIPSMILAVCATAAEVASSLLTEKRAANLLDIIGVAFMGLAFAFFALGGVLSVVDYVCGIVMFGDPLQTPAIIAFWVVMFAGVVAAIVKCFMRTEKNA